MQTSSDRHHNFLTTYRRHSTFRNESKRKPYLETTSKCVRGRPHPASHTCFLMRLSTSIGPCLPRPTSIRDQQYINPTQCLQFTIAQDLFLPNMGWTIHLENRNKLKRDWREIVITMTSLNSHHRLRTKMIQAVLMELGKFQYFIIFSKRLILSTCISYLWLLWSNDG